MKKLRWLNWGLVGASALAAFFCGFLGLIEIIGNESGRDLFDAAYGSLQLFVLESPLDVGQESNIFYMIARFLAPLTLAFTAVKTFQKMAIEEVREQRLRHMSGHAVICGLGRKGYEIARQCRDECAVVIIECDENNDFIETCRDRGDYVLTGDAAEPALLEKARAAYAKYIYLVTRDDGSNFSALVAINEIKLRERIFNQRQKVWLHLNSIDMCSFLREDEILAKVRENLDFEIVSLFESAARQLVVEELVPWLPARPEDDRRFHLILAGLGRMGRTIVRKLAQTAVTPNGIPPRATVISLDAEGDLMKLEAELPAIQTCCPTSAHRGDILHGKTLQKISELVCESQGKGEIPVVCLAVNSQYANISAALTLADPFFKNSGVSDVPIFVRQTESEGWSALAEDLTEQSEGSYKIIRGFGAIEGLCRLEEMRLERVDAIARVFHEAYLDVFGDGGAPSHSQWQDLSWQYRQSNRLLAEHLRVKLRAIGLDWTDERSAATAKFDPEQSELEMLAKLEHCRWMVEKILSKWVVGERSDYGNRVHECMVKWDELSQNEKQKDIKIIESIPAALEKGGLRLVGDRQRDG